MADVQFVWLDAMGVIFASADDVRELLLPFARLHGSVSSDEEIVELYRDCSRGCFSSAELWGRLGVSGDPSSLDDDHLAAHRLTPGIVEFARAAARAGIGVGCVSNDISEWARWLRARHGLDPYITPWLTSGDLKMRKPDPAMYERIREIGGRSASACLVVDDREANLDAAKALGFATVRFGAASERHASVADAREMASLLLERSR